METGYVQIYTGNGKGKTTAALGQGLRASGRGLHVKMIQFLKGAVTGELYAVEKLDNFSIFRVSENNKLFWLTTHQEKKKMKENTAEIITEIKNWFQRDTCDVLILDEVMAAIRNDVISVDEVIEIIHSRPPKTEVILTGRDAPEKLVAIADLISEIKAVKHYYDQGVKARIGIEK